MVPSRSRKTAGRNDAASARTHLRGTQQATRRRLDSLWLDIGHATVIDRTAPQKTRTAVRLFLYNRAVWSDRRGAVGICRSKNCHNRQADGGGDVHRSRIIAHKKLATRQQRRKISNRRFAHQANRRTGYFSRNGVRYLLLRSRTEENYIRIRVAAVTVYEISETFRRPTLRGTIGRARSDGASRNPTLGTRGRQPFFRPAPPAFSDLELHMMFVRQGADPTRAPH